LTLEPVQFADEIDRTLLDLVVDEADVLADNA
jgi:hypothetical protein